MLLLQQVSYVSPSCAYVINEVKLIIIKALVTLFCSFSRLLPTPTFAQTFGLDAFSTSNGSPFRTGLDALPGSLSGKLTMLRLAQAQAQNDPILQHLVHQTLAYQRWG